MKFKPNEEMFTIPEDERLAWAKMLRETKYGQARDSWHSPDGKNLCCMGVLAVERDNNGVMAEYFDDVWKEKYGAESEINMVPIGRRNATSYSPVNSSDEEIGTPEVDFATLNDHYELTFNQIADLLEGKEVVTDV